MITYFIQVMVGMSIAWLIYRHAFRKKAAAKYNRFFLVGGLVLPLLLPLIPLPAESIAIAQPILLPEVTILNSGSLAGASENNNWIFFVYLGGVLSMLLYRFSGLIYFFNTIQKAQKTALANGVFLVNKATMPFSFLGRIFLPTNLSHDEQELIIAHEQFHIQRMHSVDVLIGAVAHSLLWFFPLMPFYLRDLRQEHEFEVDRLMLGKTAFHNYAETLLQFNLKPIHHRLFHSFSSPNLKQRIIMMTKTHKQNAWKLILFIPLLLGLVYLNACNKQATEIQEVPNSLKMNEVDNPPQFANCPDGVTLEEAQKCFNQGLVQHLVENMNYPKEAFDAGVEGRVFVQITIDANGSMKNPEVLKSDLNTEEAPFIDMMELAALEVFTNFPELNPAQKDGNNVAIEYVVPISFKLPAGAE